MKERPVSRLLGALTKAEKVKEGRVLCHGFQRVMSLIMGHRRAVMIKKREYEKKKAFRR